MILLIDNYDSFVHNLGRYVENLGHDIKIVRNNKITLEEISFLKPEAILLSPGPNAPEQAGICVDLIRELGKSIPILGVCLGHQCIAEACDSFVVRSHKPVHGKSTVIHHIGTKLFSGVPSPFEAGLYHSLMVEIDETGPLKITATSEDNVVMAIEHETNPVYGVQFHPESILTEHGGTIIENFLGLAFTWNEKTRAA